MKKKYIIILFILMLSLFSCNWGIIITDWGTSCYLEVVNDTDENVFILAGFLGTGISEDDGSSILIPPGGKTKKYAILASLVPDLNPKNLILRTTYPWIRFYSSASKDELIIEYDYNYSECINPLAVNIWEDWKNSQIPDEDFLFGEAVDSITEALFVPSPSRCVYLERDKDDSELGRLIISSVPQP